MNKKKLHPGDIVGIIFILSILIGSLGGAILGYNDTQRIHNKLDKIDQYITQEINQDE